MLNAAIRELALPERIQALPVSDTGFPIPWFVADLPDGTRDFRVTDPNKITRAVRMRLCWVCGQPLGKHQAFVIGPMCAVNRVSSEPPSHRDCAEYSVRACPFLMQPRMRRNSKDLPEHQKPAGEMIERNPGVILIWMTQSFRPFRPKENERRYLFRIGPSEHVAWYSQGRTATRAEIQASIDSGMPLLREMAEREGTVSLAALQEQYRAALQLLPAA
jgi:hypothetical protein